MEAARDKYFAHLRRMFFLSEGIYLELDPDRVTFLHEIGRGKEFSLSVSDCLRQYNFLFRAEFEGIRERGSVY